MTDPAGPAADLARLGWSPFFADQLTADDALFTPARIDAVHRARLTAFTPDGKIEIDLPPHSDTSDYAVGDWVLAHPVTRLLHRRLDRHTLLERPGEGNRPTQLVAANVDTLLIVASCNADFNLARLERYLAFANAADIEPVIVLTKADAATDPAEYAQQAAGLQRDLSVVTINARSEEAALALKPWCPPGATLARFSYSTTQA